MLSEIKFSVRTSRIAEISLQALTVHSQPLFDTFVEPFLSHSRDRLSQVTWAHVEISWKFLTTSLPMLSYIFAPQY